MAEQQITGQHEQAIKRLRSLFEMHQIPFGAPEHLGGLLLSIHENRHFAMDFWPLVNSLSDSGSGTLSDAAMVEAVVESSTCADTKSLPADERPGVEELRQLLAGIDVSRPAEQSKKIAQPVLSASEDLVERKRSIGKTLAKLEESTRELRAQLAQLDAQMSSHLIADQLVIEPSHDEIKITGEQKSESLNKWNRMSPFGEERVIPQEIDEEAEASQIGSPMAEAAPPRRITESQQSVKTPVAAVTPSPSVVHHAAPVDPAITVESSVPVAVFDPRPARTLRQRGLAISDPDDDPRIIAPLSKYGDAEEPSSLKRLVVSAVILVLLAVAAFAAARTETGHAWLQRAVDSARDAYSSATAKKNETRPPIAETLPQTPPPATQTVPGEAASSAAPTAPPSGVTPEPAAQSAQSRRSSDTPDDEASPQHEKVVDAGVLRVPAATMAANLITSRVPAYPESARIRNIEGAVIMDVVISKTGTVKYVRVIDGDRHLHAAAQDAVLRWRYKPYLLNGEPVEVTTTVKLDFHLPQ